MAVFPQKILFFPYKFRCNFILVVEFVFFENADEFFPKLLRVFRLDYKGLGPERNCELDLLVAGINSRVKNKGD
jgi:hypothetical protein